MRISEIKDQRVLFITTKNVDYIRNVQEIHILKSQCNQVNVISSNSKYYFIRICTVYLKILFTEINEIDTIFIGFAPQLLLPFLLGEFRRCYIIIDFFISIYDTLVFDRKVVKENSLSAKLLKQMDIISLRKANHVIVDTNAHGNYFVDEFGLDKNKGEVIYLEADKSVYYPRLQKKSETLKDKFVVLYFASMLPLQGVEIVLEAINFFKNDSDIYFQIIGPINNKFKTPISNNIQYYDWLSQEELAKYIANADLCLAGHFSKEIEKANRTIPGKAFIFEMMNKKMILGDSEANREKFNNKNCTFVKRGCSNSLIEKIQGAKDEYRK